MDKAKQERLIALLKEKGMWPKEDGQLIFSDEYEDPDDGRRYSYYGSFEIADIIAAVGEMDICDYVSIPGGGESSINIMAKKTDGGEMLEICFRDRCNLNISPKSYTLLNCKLSEFLD